MIYKLKHKPTGLYWQNSKIRFGRGNGNLSTKGKIFEGSTAWTKCQNGTEYTSLRIGLGKIFNLLKDKYSDNIHHGFYDSIFIHTKPEDWEQEIICNYEN